ncbi:MAG: site-specific integrase [Enterocloster asparagiformis]|nr:site-specific integrase [Enterocloster asparagiformis]
MPSIRKNDTGYEITISDGYDSNGKKVRTSRMFTPDPKWIEERAEAEAMKFALRLEERIKNGDNVSADKLTIEKLARLYLNDVQPPEIARATYYSYKQIIQYRIIPYLGREKVTRVNGHTVKNYTTKLRTPGVRMDGKKGALSEGTIRKDIAVLSAMLSYGVSEGLITINPLLYSGKRRGGKKAAKEYKVKNFTIEQSKWFLWALDNPIDIRHAAHTRTLKNGKTYTVKEYVQRWQLPLKWRFCFNLALFTGDRRGENIGLTWEDIDFEKCTVNIDKSTASVDGETYTKETKTGSTRVVVVPPFVMDIGRELLAEQKRACLQLGDKWVGFRGRQFSKNHVFQQWDGSQMDLGSPRHEFKRLVRIYNENVAKNDDEKLPEEVTLHDLRHTTASILISNNMDPRSVASILGHADPSTTLNIYAYFFRSKTQEAADIMSSVLSRSTTEQAVVGK